MRSIMLALLVGVTMLAVPNVAADHQCSDPGYYAEVCTSSSSYLTDVNEKEVYTYGCAVSVNGECVPTGAWYSNGASITSVKVPGLVVGVDVHVFGSWNCAYSHSILEGCYSTSIDTATYSRIVTNLV